MATETITLTLTEEEQQRIPDLMQQVPDLQTPADVLCWLLRGSDHSGTAALSAIQRQLTAVQHKIAELDAQVSAVPSKTAGHVAALNLHLHLDGLTAPAQEELKQEAQKAVRRGHSTQAYIVRDESHALCFVTPDGSVTAIETIPPSGGDRGEHSPLIRPTFPASPNKPVIVPGKLTSAKLSPRFCLRFPPTRFLKKK